MSTSFVQMQATRRSKLATNKELIESMRQAVIRLSHGLNAAESSEVRCPRELHLALERLDQQLWDHVDDLEIELEDTPDYPEEEEFQDPGGNSALRRATPDNPRIHPCPTCGRPNMLTPKDVQLGY